MTAVPFASPCLTNALSRYLRPPSFSDENSTHTAFLLHVILWSWVLVVTVFVLISYGFTAYVDGSSTLYERALTAWLVWVVPSALFLVLLHHGKLRLAILGHLFVSWTATSAMALTAGGTMAPGLFIYAVIILESGLLLWSSIGWGMAALCTLSLFLLAVAERQQLLPEMTVTHGPLSRAGTIAIMLWLMVALQTLATRTIRRSLQQARQELTERRAAEAALAVSELQYRTLFEQAPIGVAILDAAGRVQRINPGTEAMLGYSEAELSNQSVLSLIPQPDLAQYPSAGTERLCSVEAISGEKRLRRRDGSLIHVRTGVKALPDGQWQVAFTDISDLKAAEVVLRQSGEALERRVEERTRALSAANDELLLAAIVYRTCGEAILVTNNDNQIISVNPAFTEITGYSLEAVIGRNPKLLSSGAQDAAFYQAMWLAIETSNGWQGEICNRRKDGQNYFEWLTIRKVLDDNGEQHGYVAVFSDITRQKITHELDRHHNQVLEMLTKDAPLPAILERIVLFVQRQVCHVQCAVRVLDGEGKRLLHGAAPGLPDFFNEAMHGLPIGLESGSSGTAICTGEMVKVDNIASHPYWVKFREVAQRAGFVASWSAPLKSIACQKLGTLDIYWRAPPAPNEDELRIIQSAIQLAGLAIERKQSEDEVRSCWEAALQANVAKSEFLSNMSHELRTPLNSVLGFSQLLLSDEEHPLSEEQKSYVQIVLDGGQHLLNLINDILDLSKIESSQIDTHPDNVLLDDILPQCFALVHSLAEKNAVRLIAPEYPLSLLVYADATRLRQVLVNLLSNAIKYNQPGGSVSLSFNPGSEERLQICITDTGIGIPINKQAELFKPFQRLGFENSAIEGSGIGLALTKRLVELMHGRIGFESRAGIGSTFWIELPWIKEQLTERISPPSGEISLPAFIRPVAAPQKVLYIEDNHFNLFYIQELLQSVEGVHLLTATDAEQGLKLAETERPDLILLDINLPGMDGYEALRHLKSSPATAPIPVLALTVNATPEDMGKGLEAGFIDYLTKPVDMERVITALATHLHWTVAS
ncbi:MAG: PAS domain S-box protein [Methylococcaceae bacterium]|nr:MAG: PAS domain S-box protein [Methylococcaceae bacterium]